MIFQRLVMIYGLYNFPNKWRFRCNFFPINVKTCSKLLSSFNYFILGHNTNVMKKNVCANKHWIISLKSIIQLNLHHTFVIFLKSTGKWTWDTLSKYSIISFFRNGKFFGKFCYLPKRNIAWNYYPSKHYAHSFVLGRKVVFIWLLASLQGKPWRNKAVKTCIRWDIICCLNL